VRIEIQPHEGMPIYRQISNQIKYLIASGQLKTGQELPGVRTLAEQLTVTPNTIVKAYDELEAEGLLEKRRGSGTYVSDTDSPLTRREQRRILTQRIDATLTEASQLNFTLEEVLALLHDRHAALTRTQAKFESKGD
jgi:GntR family transcriptional regulator